MSDPVYEFDARTFALTWLTVASAASEDPERFHLYRSVNVELDPDGVRLTSTDSYRFWSQWVGEATSCKEPNYDDNRGESVIVSDDDFRARDLMKYIAKCTRKEDDPDLTLRLSFGPAPREDGQLIGMESRAATFTVSDTGTNRLHESLLLPLFDGEYPDLRNIYNGHAPEAVERIAFNPDLLNKMMKAAPGSEDYPCKIIFSGETGIALIEPFDADKSWPLRGALMPVRIES
jgi:hypothetical protein